MKVKVVTLGCKVNTFESEELKRELSDYGYTITEEESDLVVINGCSVTHVADTKSDKEVRRALKTGAKVVLMGCHEPKGDLLKDILFIPNEEKHRVVQMILDTFGRGEKVSPYVDQYTRSFVKVQDGCNNFCSYCIIPYMRGREVSYPLDSILSDVALQVERGHKEIILSGINLSHYGKDTGSSLIELAEKVDGVPGVMRLRFGSLEQSIVDDDFLARLKKLESFCPQFHLSLQSGSDTVLKRMNRHYTTKEYLDTVERIRSYFPKAAITTDIIVGFPGETEEEFLETMDFVKAVRFSRVHVFPYSRREGTKAALLKDLPRELKRERHERLTAITEALEVEYASSFVGEMVEVLFEEEGGFTREYVRVQSDKEYGMNEIIRAKVISQKGNVCWI
ncbi:tRNA (N(6)-L-threonylcarbamoyladenosine(37)-C(2))-methylthiotransferase MtaB [Guggenheimella bovis]